MELEAPAFAAGREEKIMGRIILFRGQPAIVERPEIAAVGVALAVHDGKFGVGSVGGVVPDWFGRMLEFELWIAVGVVIDEHLDLGACH